MITTLEEYYNERLEARQKASADKAPNRQGEPWLKYSIDKCHAEHPEIRIAWDKAGPGGYTILASIEAYGQRLLRSMLVPAHLLGNPDYLDGTLDYSWLTMPNAYPDDHYGGGTD